jgi:hypothetical protein
MDVGANNFRFELDDPEMKARTIRWPKTAELHLDSLDRYTLLDTPILSLSGGADQNTAKLFGPIFSALPESGTNNCQIQPKRNLIYGYMSRVALTQFNLNYNVPTVVAGYNDLFGIGIGPSPGPVYFLTIPPGYYNVVTLAAQLQTMIRGITGNPLPAATVIAPASQTSAFISRYTTGFIISSGSVAEIQLVPGLSNQSTATANNYGRVWRMLGVNNQALATTLTLGTPNLRPTDYVDIVSNTLTNYKDTKDANSSVQSPGGVIGRIWLSEAWVNSQTATNGYPDPNLAGTGPLALTKTWVNPNWSQWSPNQSISSIDFTLLDMWGNPLFWSSTYPTEWSATLTVTE